MTKQSSTLPGASQMKTNQNDKISKGEKVECIKCISDLPYEVRKILAQRRKLEGFYRQKISQDMPGGCVLHIHKYKSRMRKFGFHPKLER